MLIDFLAKRRVLLTYEIHTKIHDENGKKIYLMFLKFNPYDNWYNSSFYFKRYYYISNYLKTLYESQNHTRINSRIKIN